MQALERELILENWITIILVVSFLLIAVLKSLHSSKLKGYFFAFFNKGFIETEAEENDSFFTVFHSTLLLFSTSIISLFLYFLLKNSTVNFTANTTSFFIIFLLVFSFLVLKWSLEFLISKLFEVNNQVRYFLFLKYSYLHTISFCLFVLLIIYVYGYKNYSVVLLPLLFLIFIRVLLLLINNKKLITSKLFYFILYICAFEIAPLFILIKSVF